MILKHNDIRTAHRQGMLHIHPFVKDNVGPNSVDVRLGNTLLTYDLNASGGALDCAKPNPTKTLTIPKEGLILQPGTLYLGSTVESVGSNHYVPMLEGRSSVARLGISIHATAGFGDLGFQGQWTLEITVTHPVRVYADMRIGQVFFLEAGDYDGDNLYNGKYNDQEGPKASKMYKDFE